MFTADFYKSVIQEVAVACQESSSASGVCVLIDSASVRLSASVLALSMCSSVYRSYNE